MSYQLLVTHRHQLRPDIAELDNLVPRRPPPQQRTVGVSVELDMSETNGIVGTDIRAHPVSQNHPISSACHTFGSHRGAA
jgi:hypothetical protein